MKQRWGWAISVFVLLLLGGTSGAQQQQCTDCDCNHFPIAKECKKCCGVASGKITSVTNSSVVINENAGEKAFALTLGTKKNADLKEGAQATVYYHKEGDVATRIDLIDRLSGLLIPGHETDPPVPAICSKFPIPPGALKLYFGEGSLGYTMSDEVTVLTIKGQDLLSLRRTDKGLAINAKTFSDDGNIIAEIVDNRFYINPNNFFRMDRPNNHSLIVYDLHDRKVLDIDYVNPHSVKVLGIFQVPGVPPIIFGNGGLSVTGAGGGTGTIGNSCVGGSSKLFSVN
ncbi:MAG: hypothetical protein WAM58_03110 [Candidatus Acidiferrum sp.]